MESKNKSNEGIAYTFGENEYVIVRVGSERFLGYISNIVRNCVCSYGTVDLVFQIVTYDDPSHPFGTRYTDCTADMLEHIEEQELAAEAFESSMIHSVRDNLDQLLSSVHMAATVQDFPLDVLNPALFAIAPALKTYRQFSEETWDYELRRG